jgi:hypothetical protein
MYVIQYDAWYYAGMNEWGDPKFVQSQRDSEVVRFASRVEAEETQKTHTTLEMGKIIVI